MQAVADVFATLFSVLAALSHYKDNATANESALDLTDSFYAEVLKGTTFAEQVYMTPDDQQSHQLPLGSGRKLQLRCSASHFDCLHKAMARGIKEADGCGEETVVMLMRYYGLVLHGADADVHALSWAAVNIAHQEQFGNVLGLIYVILSLPGRQLMLRGFSQLKLTRSTIRLNLSGQLIDLMTVQMMSLLIEVFGVPTVLTHNHWAIDG